MLHEEIVSETTEQLQLFQAYIDSLKRFKKLEKLKVIAPFPCNEVFQSLGTLLEELGVLKELEVSFIMGDFWKD